MGDNTTLIQNEVAYLKAKCNDFKDTYTLSKEFTTVGRIGKNDIKLAFGSVSRTHATFVRTPVGYKVVDAGSKHGIVVNGTRVIEKYLSEGDKIQIGDVHLLFTYKEPAKPKEPPPEMSSEVEMPPANDDVARDIRVLKKQVQTLLDKAERLSEQIEALEKQVKSSSRELDSE